MRLLNASVVRPPPPLAPLSPAPSPQQQQATQQQPQAGATAAKGAPPVKSSRGAKDLLVPTGDTARAAREAATQSYNRVMMGERWRGADVAFI